jgi:short-subunit dehydrogenase
VVLGDVKAPDPTHANDKVTFVRTDVSNYDAVLTLFNTPNTAVLDVNLKGTIFFTRVAVHYLRRSLAQNASMQKDASILLVSSVAGFGNWPGLFQYCEHICSKHK